MKRILSILLLLTLLCSHGFGLGYEGIKPGLGARINWGDPLARGLVGHLLMNEGSGDKVYDLNGNGQTGTLNGDTVWRPGRFGPALSLDGNQDYVLLSSLTGYGRGIPHTYIAWINIPAVSSGNYYWVLNNGAAATGSSLVLRKVTTMRVGMLLRGGNTPVSGNTAISLNTWHQVACSLNEANQCALYLDGVLDGSGAGDGTAYTGANTSPNIGLWYDLASYDFNGMISFLQVYNRALSATEVQQLYMTPFRILEHRPIEIWAGVSGEIPAMIYDWSITLGQ